MIEAEGVHPDKTVEVAGKSIAPIILGTSRVATEKLPDGSFVPKRDHDDWEIEILKYALSQGFNSIDTARSYGDAEVIVGKAIQGLTRKKLLIATKVGMQFVDPAGLRREIEESCDRLGTVPDLVYLHNRHEGHMGEEMDLLIEELNNAVDAGMAGRVGISNFRPDELRRAINVSRHKIIAYQAKVNIVNPRQDYKELDQVCRENKIHFIASSSLDRGKVIDIAVADEISTLMSKYELTTAQLGLLTVLLKGILPIVQSHDREHIKQNIGVLDKVVSADDIAKLAALM
jgi:diketogulonate reductase-like aldo/keto reductase